MIDRMSIVKDIHLHSEYIWEITGESEIKDDLFVIIFAILHFKMSIIDSHVHFWQPNHPTVEIPWLKKNAKLNRSFMPNDYKEATSGIPIEEIVFVECDVKPEDALKEVEWISEMAHHQETRIKAIVAFAPVEKGEEGKYEDKLEIKDLLISLNHLHFLIVRPYLEQLKKFPLVKGIRRLIQGEPEVDFCSRPNFVRGVQIVLEMGFSFDICIIHPQLSNAIKLVSQCPSNGQFVSLTAALL
jgi:L-fuconolactonase